MNPARPRSTGTRLLILTVALSIACSCGNPSDADRALHDALGRGDFARARELIRAGAAVDARFAGRMTVLMRLSASCAPGAADGLEMLLDAGATIDLRDAEGRSALMHAAGNGCEDNAMLLLAAGADPTLRDAGGRTPPELAAAAGHAETARRLRVARPP